MSGRVISTRCDRCGQTESLCRCGGPEWQCESCDREMNHPAVCWACGSFVCDACKVENRVGEWVCPSCAVGDACQCDTHQTLRAMVAR